MVQEQARGAKPKMKQVNVDGQSKEIQDFIQNLPVTHREGCLLIVHGKPLMKVVANTDIPIDRRKRVEAIRAGREESRRLNQEWEAADEELEQKLMVTEKRRKQA